MLLLKKHTWYLCQLIVIVHTVSKIIKEKEAPTTDPAEKSSANKAQEEVKPAKQRKRITPPDNNETIVKHELASSSKPTEHTPERSSRPRS